MYISRQGRYFEVSLDIQYHLLIIKIANAYDYACAINTQYIETIMSSFPVYQVKITACNSSEMPRASCCMHASC